MSLANFRDLLDAARRQSEPQRLLFVFARVELPEHATEEQRLRHERRDGGTISPCLCVDKAPSEIASFEASATESATTGQDWAIGFRGSLSGRASVAPSTDGAARAERCMVNTQTARHISDFASHHSNTNDMT